MTANSFITSSKTVVKLFLLVLLVTMGYSQNNINFEHLTTKDGLSQSDINCIYQDQEGFLWFGTHDGLNKYDGYQFTNYVPESNNDSSISSNLIFAITGDKKGNLWIGTTGGGLNYYDKRSKKFQRFRYDPDDINSIDSDIIRFVYVDKSNRLWVCTNKGINVLQLENADKTHQFNRIKYKSQISVNAIFEDKNGQIWIACNQGLLKLEDLEDGTLSLQELDINHKTSIRSVSFIGEDSNGQLLIGTSKGIFLKDSNKEIHKFTLISGMNAQCFVIDDKNQFWLGTNNGLFQFEQSTGDGSLKQKSHHIYDPINSNSISKNIIRVLYKDRTGIIWVGTNGGAINKIDPNKKQFQHIRKTSDPNSLSYDKIRSMHEDGQGNLWIGTEGGGLNLLLRNNDDDGKFTDFKKFGTISKPFALEEITLNGRRTLLIGSGDKGSLWQLDIENAKQNRNAEIKLLLKTNKGVFTILEDKNKTVWVGTYGGGVYRMTPSNSNEEYKIDLFKKDLSNEASISDNIIRNIYQDKNANIWFGTGNGLSKLTAEQLLLDQPSFINYRNKPDDNNSISYNYILPIYESNSGDLYIGTMGGGLNKYVPAVNRESEKFISFSNKDGLPNNVIKSILEDDSGNLWLSTNNGLSKFNPQNETFKNYDINDGLQNNEFQELAGLKRKSGELLFGGINGFNTFFPSEIKDNLTKAETVITKFSLSNKAIVIGEKNNGNIHLDSAINYTTQIDLKHNQNSFSFEFAALHYGAPLKNKYSYILEGYDTEWNLTPSNIRLANYTNIAPGNYIFKVKASNSDGIWDASPKIININISSPFWETGVAYFLYAIMGIGLLGAYRRYTLIGTTKKHQLELEHIEKEKHEELQRVKLEFFTNISHEFRTPLTLLKGPLEYLMNSERTRENEDIQEQCHIMKRNTNYLMRLVNQLLDFRKLNQGKMRLVIRNTEAINFVKEICEPFQFIAHNQNIRFSVETTQKSIKTWFDHDAMEKIMNNLLSNAFKFTPKNGEILISISKEEKLNPSSNNSLTIKVTNTGKGIDKEEIHNIFDRFYTQKKLKHNNPVGSGIGLAFTKNLINFHQGTIEVMSKPNQETSFIVKLPSAKKAYIDIPEISIKEKTESDFFVRSSESESFAIDLNDEIVDAPISKSKSKLPVLLIVDDNKDVRKFIKKALADTFKVVEAKDGEEGLDVALKIVPNLILSDVLMPVMDGIEFCTEVKNNSKTSHIPIIMVTAKTSQESEIEALKIGADGYVKKPFDLEILKLKLTNILKQRAALRKKFNREITLQPSEVTVTSLDTTFLERAIAVVEKHMMNTDFSVELLVNEMGQSRSNLYIKLKRLTGLSSSEFIRNIRLKRAVQLLEQSEYSVKEIMHKTGFSTSSYFSKCFKKQFGVQPTQYLKQLKSNRSESVENPLGKIPQ